MSDGNRLLKLSRLYKPSPTMVEWIERGMKNTRERRIDEAVRAEGSLLTVWRAANANRRVGLWMGWQILNEYGIVPPECLDRIRAEYRRIVEREEGRAWLS